MYRNTLYLLCHYVLDPLALSQSAPELLFKPTTIGQNKKKGKKKKKLLNKEIFNS